MSTTAEKIAVMNGFDAGCEIECLILVATHESWYSDKQPLWNWGTCDYRIKQKPREFWANLYKAPLGAYIYPSKKQADIGAGEGRVGCILLREVMP